MVKIRTTLRLVPDSRERELIPHHFNEQPTRLYQEGGLIYLYTFGYNRAHSFIDNNSLAKAKSAEWFTNTEEGEIGMFFEKSLSNPFPDSVGVQAKKFTNELLATLKEDFYNMYAFISSHDKDDDIGNILTLTFLKGNNFHSLELFWSID